jgi:hypothetical protein
MAQEFKAIFSVSSTFFWQKLQVFPAFSLKVIGGIAPLAPDGKAIKATLGEDIGIVIDNSIPEDYIKVSML